MVHSPTPWHIENGDIMSAVPNISIHSVVDDVSISDADKQRIVDCVNACAGMDQPSLVIANMRGASKAIPAMCAEVESLRKQNTNLVQAMKDVLNLYEHDPDDLETMDKGIKIIRQSLELAKGGG